MLKESSLVEGMGDEVLLFVATLVLGLTILLAWWSTHVSDRMRLQAVILQPIRSRDVHEDHGEDRLEPEGHVAQVLFDEEGHVEEAVQDEAPTGHVVEEEESGSPEAKKEETEADEVEHHEESPDHVRIKLKFLNDSQREVVAPLTEELGRFKRRHFATDMAENKTVRLIFNGHVLNGDRQPLSHYGLFDNCVVHCLISRASNNSSNNNPDTRHRNDNVRVAHASWLSDNDDNLDFSHICYPLLGSVLAMIWWCQLVYSHYFSLTSSVSLVALTVLFLASITNTYLY